MQDHKDLPHWFAERAQARLERLYGEYQVASLLHRIIELMLDHRQQFPPVARERWSEQDVVLITYGDSIKAPGEVPLRTLHRFLKEELSDSINSVHILPFFPYSSDDGFSVIDYRQINKELGDWNDLKDIGKDFNLMFDLVINHCSRENLWFIDYINNVAPGNGYFIEIDPDTDLRQVVRPRSSPLLVPVHTHSGIHHVWATFSEDQIDLNYRNPEVLIEFIRIFLFYIAKGARFIRLDAIAFLWKEIGTRCIHLRHTHEVVKLLRDIIEAAAPQCVLITETNVPNGENISYFGSSDEAHMVYQFSLPPLLLYALHRGTASQLTHWAMDYPRPPSDCTYLNFIASHDGIGLRPLEGILSANEVNGLIESMREYGGYVAMKSNPDGTEGPYEINISLFDALKGTWRGTDQWQISRFICAQSVMLVIQGIPALYLHSLTATPNDQKGVEQSGRTRSINRHRWALDELSRLLQDPASPQAIVLAELKHRLRIRSQQQAFHPESDQRTIDLGDGLFSLWRLGRHQRILTVHNVTDQQQQLALPPHPCTDNAACWKDLLSDEIYPREQVDISLGPYQVRWLEACRAQGKSSSVVD